MTQTESGQDRRRILRYLRTLLDKAQDELDEGAESPRITPSQALAAARQLERVGDMDDEAAAEAPPEAAPEPAKSEKRSGMREITEAVKQKRRKEKARKKALKHGKPLPDFADLPTPPMLE